MNGSKARQVAGQLIYFEATERAAPARRTMAKVALSVAGDPPEACATLDEVFALL